ncbi:replication protein P [Siccibacter turicensis]|uniref:replication protein P n=1 Tax=Siccibacter turicensis TaxID=357233 RepID=UPI003F56344E
MKSIAEQMVVHEREQFRRMAHNLPEQHDDDHSVHHVAQVINGVFSQLLAAFPASLVNRDQNELNEIRRQWVLAFKENAITSMEQVNAGMRVARRQEKPFLPSPGQFVAWCREESSSAAGLPTVSELVDMVGKYCAKRGFYSAPESYPWQHPSHYWMVTALYSGMRANNWTQAELERRASTELTRMVSRITSGEEIPKPRVMIEKLGGRPVSQEQGLKHIAEIRKKHGLGGQK